jgi:hypothetical protein
MPSKLKSDTARANGAKSRGPKTAEGREKSSRNSLRHGFTSLNTVLLACEDPDAFQQLLAEYISTYRPETAAEKDLVEEMVAARWRIRRIWTAETALIDLEMITQEAEIKKKFDYADPGIQLGLAFRSLADGSRSLSLASRYESRLHRVYSRAYQTLRELQQARKPSPTQPSAQPEPPQPEPGAEAHGNPPEPLPAVCGGAGDSPALVQKTKRTHRRALPSRIRRMRRIASAGFQTAWGRFSTCAPIWNRRKLARVTKPARRMQSSPTRQTTRG